MKAWVEQTIQVSVDEKRPLHLEDGLRQFAFISKNPRYVTPPHGPRVFKDYVLSPDSYQLG